MLSEYTETAALLEVAARLAATLRVIWPSHSSALVSATVIQDWASSSTTTLYVKFVDRGIDVYIPLGDNSRADLAADFNGKLQKIQVKTSTTTDNTRTIFAVSQSSFNVVDGEIKLKRKNYTPDEVDYLALYDQHADRLFLVDTHKLNKRAMNIRYTVPKNNNPNVNYADDYDFDKVLDEIEFKNQGIIDAENFEVIDDE